MHMFLELLVVRDFRDTSSMLPNGSTPASPRYHGGNSTVDGVTKAIDLFNKYFARAVVTHDPSLAAMAATLHCIRAVQLAHTIADSLLAAGDSQHINDRKAVTPSRGMSTMSRNFMRSPLPSLGDVARNPMLFTSVLMFLQSYEFSFSRYVSVSGFRLIRQFYVQQCLYIFVCTATRQCHVIIFFY
jgi:hypothetical protein